MESTFSSAFKSLKAELTAVMSEQIVLLANFNSFKICFETIEKCSNTLLTINFKVIEEAQNRLSRNNKLLVFNVVETSINRKNEHLVTINTILNDLSLNSVVNNARRIDKPSVKPRHTLVELSHLYI